MRNLQYQSRKAAALVGREREAVQMMEGFSAYVEQLLAPHTTVEGARVLEVGSGAHGLVFYFNPTCHRVGLDPAAVEYAALFPQWQRRASTVAAFGESLPFATASVDIVLSHNVIDHAEEPGAILSEIVRVLRPGGVLYFTVHVHHWIYHLASQLHGAWRAIGIPYEMGEFADHTVHFTPNRIRRMIRGLPLRAVRERVDFDQAGQNLTPARRRLVRDAVKRLWFILATYELVAVRE